MPCWLSAVAHAITSFNHRLFQLTVWLMAIVVPVMLIEVVMRYVFNAPTVWGMELAVLLFGPYFLFGGPYLLHIRGHVALDLLRQRLSPRWARRLDLVNYPVIVLFCAILLWHSAPLAFNAWSYRETSFSAWNPPVWPFKVAVPVAMLLMVLQALVGFVRTWYGEIEGEGDAVALATEARP